MGWENMTVGSVVGAPAGSRSAPSGAGRPLLRATLILPNATLLVAMSRITDGRSVAGRADADRVRRQPAIAAAERRHIGAMADDVDVMHGGEAGDRALLRPGADAAEMVRAPKGDERHAMLARPRDADRPSPRVPAPGRRRFRRRAPRPRPVADDADAPAELQTPLAHRRHIIQ